jgi:hypothetical protein
VNQNIKRDLSPKVLFVDPVLRLLCERVGELLEKDVERRLVLGRDLDADEDLAEVRAVVPIVEQGDVPGLVRLGGVEVVQEFVKRVGSLGEFCGEKAVKSARHDLQVATAKLSAILEKKTVPNRKILSSGTTTRPPMRYLAWSLLISSSERSQACMPSS